MWCRSRFGRNPTGNLQQKGNKTKLMVDQLRTHIEHAVRIWPNDAWSACWIAQLQLPGLLRSRATVWVLKDLDVSAETNKIPIGVTDLAQFPFFWLVAVSRCVDQTFQVLKVATASLLRLPTRPGWGLWSLGSFDGNGVPLPRYQPGCRLSGPLSLHRCHPESRQSSAGWHRC